MEKGQKEAIHYEFPQYAGKVHMLTETNKAPYDFPDPLGVDILHVDKCLNEIKIFLESNFHQIYEKALSI